jgi:hypothetical protein
MLCGAALALTVPHLAAQQEFSSANRKLGKAAVQYRDKAIQMVAAYYYSQQNHDSRWLLIQAGLSTEEEQVIERDAIVLRTPQGREITLASQRRVGEDVKRVEQLLQNASAVSHNVASYFNQRNEVESMKLFTLPFGPVVHNNFISDRYRVALGPLFFESPTGAWERGTYALVLRHAKGTAELPIHLE